MKFNETNPGIAKVVTMLQDANFDVIDSDDGITNMGLEIEGASDEHPFVTMLVDPQSMVTESHRLMELLKSKSNCLDPNTGLGYIMITIEAIYSPFDGKATLILTGLDDEDMFGFDEDLTKKRLEYQIRFCDAWLKENAPQRGNSNRAFYRNLHDTLALQLADLNFDLPPF